MKLFFSFHPDGFSRADKGADAASFAEFEIDFNAAAGRVARDAEFRAGEAAKIAALAEMIAQTSPSLFNGGSLIKSGFRFKGHSPGFFKFAFFGEYWICFRHDMYFNLV
jgi:hypothetical protein